MKGLTYVTIYKGLQIKIVAFVIKIVYISLSMDLINYYRFSVLKMLLWYHYSCGSNMILVEARNSVSVVYIVLIRVIYS